MSLPDPWDLPQRVRERVYDHAYAYPDAEVGGVLVGTFPSATQTTTRVAGVLPAFEAEGDLTSLTFTHDVWADLHSLKDLQFPREAIVGWYHTHPGHGIFLSEHDLFVHRNFFPNEASLAYVVDPVRHEEGLFAVLQGEICELFIRPIDTVEALVDRRRDRSRATAPAPDSSRWRDSTPSALGFVARDLGVVALAAALALAVARVVFA